MSNSNILVVEDDFAIRNLITTALEMENYKYRIAKSGDQAIIEAATQYPELILLDLGLPDMDGVDVIKKIRSWSTVPIIVISARSDDKDKIDALDAGADDYVTKPFSTAELLARISRETKNTILFITHDIDEAILLADRIYVMSRRPGTIREVLEVKIEGERSHEMLVTPDFLEMKRKIMDMLWQESQDAALDK